MKKGLSAVLSVVLALSLLPIPALATEPGCVDLVALNEAERTKIASGACSTNLTWTLYSNGELRIGGRGGMSTDTSYPWYSYRASITSVVIDPGVTCIGGGAFSDCENLNSVTIPSSVSTIWDRAFDSCESLTSVTIPASVIHIWSDAFSDCPGLKTAGPIGGEYNIQFGWTTEIPPQAFNGCNSLTSVTIPEGVTSIGRYAFCNCTDLTNMTIPEGVTSIGRNAFSECTGLTSITIPSTITSIETFMFYDCKGLKDVIIPEGVTNIGSHAFSGCTGLTSAVIPDGVTSIETMAFADCTNLTSVTIPASVTSIGLVAFYGCPNLTVYGNAGSEAERYCVENDIPFVAGAMPGTAQEGKFENASAWAISAKGEVSVTFSATADPDETILVGGYDNKGRFVEAKPLNVQNPVAQIDPAMYSVKLFYLDDARRPLTPSVTVWGK